MWEYDAEVVRVIDGDTVALNVDLGFRTWHESAFRLTGIDAPEINAQGPEGEAARDFLRVMLQPGHRVHIRTQKSPDKYGRWLATIWILDDEGERLATSINTMMVEEGHAVLYNGGAR